jgi:cyclic pyranopterin phosphate synthase
MLDRYNREINYLRVSITDRCNLRCKYCTPKEGLSLFGHDDILRYEEISRIVSAAARIGITKVRITGGEPLVRRGVVGFIQSLSSIDGLRDVSLTTNGILLEELAEKLFAAGMKRINISMDSLDLEKYAYITGGGDLHKVLAGIEAVHRVGFSPIKINIVAMKGFNDNEILDFAKLTVHKPYQIRFIELMNMGNAAINHHDQYLSNMLIKEIIIRNYPLDPVNNNKNKSDGPAEIYRITDGAGEIGFISPLSHKFCRTCNRLRLTADGRLRICLLSDEEVDLKGPLRNGCTDAELTDLIEMAISQKPLQHDISCEEIHRKKCMTDMSSIGG